MAYEMYDLKGILFLVLAIPMIASTNIDCSGKAFHCVNSTHFMICVDLGGGVSTTIDDFVIPCPPTTVCHEHNVFECEFPKTLVTTPALQVIGVSKQSDISVTHSVSYSFTDPTPPDKSSIVFTENTTVKPVSIPEEVTFTKKIDVLENFKEPNEIINVKKTNNNSNRNTSATDNNIILDLTAQTSTDKAVSAADKSKSIDTVTTATSIIKLNELISNDSRSLENSSNILYNRTISANVSTIKQLMKKSDVNQTIADETSITTMDNSYIWNGPNGISKTDHNNENLLMNKTFIERNSVSENSTTEKLVINENQNSMLEPLLEVLIDQTTTVKNFTPLGFADLFNVTSPTTTFNTLIFLNTSHGTTATEEHYTTTRAIVNGGSIKNISDLKSDTLSEVSTTTVANADLQNINKNNVFKQNESFYQNFVEQIPITEVTGNKQVPEKIIKYISPVKIENSVSAPATVVTSPQKTTDAVLNNNDDSFVENVTDPYPLEITITTDLIIKFTNSSYQMNRESSKAFIATNNNVSDSNETIATIQAVYNTSSTDMFNAMTTELNTFLTATTIYLTTEIPNLQNEPIANETGVEKDVSPASITSSVNKTPSDINTTPVPHTATFSSVTNITVKDRISHTDIFSNASTDTVDKIALQNYPFLDRSTTKDAILTNQGSKANLNQLDVVKTAKFQENIYQLNKTAQDEIVNKTNTVYLRDVSKQVILNNSFYPIKTDKKPTTTPSIYANEFTTNIPETIYKTTISMDSVPTVPNYNTEITDKSVSARDYNVKKSASLPLDVTDYTNIGGGEETFINMLITTTPTRESITQMDTHKLINTNSVSTERFTDTMYSSIATIPSKTSDFMSNWKDSDNIETTTSTVDHNKGDNKNGSIKSINIKNLEITTLRSAMTNTSKDDTASSFINSRSQDSLKPSHETLLNSTKNTVANISVSDGYIGTIELENSSFYTTLTNYTPGNKFTQIIEPASKKSESLQKNTLTTESLPQNGQMNLESLTTSSQITPMKENNTENGESFISPDSPLSIVGLDQRDSTTNSINYVTEKIMDFASQKEVISIKQTSLPNVEKEVTIPVSGLVIDRTTKTTASIPSTTHTVHTQGIKNTLVERKGLPVFTTVIDTQTNNYDNIKSLLKPVLEPSGKNYTLSRVTSAPIAVIYSDISKIKTSDLQISPMPTANYNVPQSMIDVTTETVESYVTAAGLMVDTLEGIGKKIIKTNNDANVSFSEVKNSSIINSDFDSNSAKNVIDHENIFMYNNTFQNNTQNTINTLKQTDINIESAQKRAFKINDSRFEYEVTSETSVSISTNIENKTLPTDPLTYLLPLDTEINHNDTIQADFVKYELPMVTTNPLHAIETGSPAPKYLTQSKTLEVFTDKLLNNRTEVTYLKQDKVLTDTQNISIKINNAKANLITSYSNLPQQNNVVNGSLEEHLKSKNHTITTEIQGYFNKSDKHTNELKSSGVTIRNGNITTRSIKLNSDSKHNIIINGSASVFNCLNHTRGKYADKKDCRKFYTCVGKLQPIIGTCPNNTVFSEINKQCTRNLSHCVRNNQFRCLLEGRFSDFFQDNIYYICVKNSINAFVRYKLQCQNGYHLNKVSVKCETNEDVPSQSASSASENSKINNDESKPKIETEETRKINSTTDFECISEGTFPYEKDCRKYYVCTNVKNIYRRKIRKCASDEIFDNSKKKCIESESIEC